MRRGATAAFAPVAFATVVVAGGLLSGCAAAPSQVGTAAIVGDTTVSLESVQDWFDRVVADRERKERARASEQLDDIGRKVVTEAVRHALLLQVAQREKLDIDEERVNELLDELGGPAQAVEALAKTPGTEWLLYDETTIRERVRDQLIALELARKYYDSTEIRFDATQAENRNQALDKANRIASDPDGVDEIIQADIAGGLQAFANEKLSVAADPSTAAHSPLFAVPAGTVVVYAAGGQGGWWVIYIGERDSDAPRDNSPNVVEEGSVDQSLMSAIGFRMMAALMADTEVELNPRYGVWEQVSLEATQTDGERLVTTVSVEQPDS
ncbi:MAG TPA: hypothetical protein VFM37_09280 [Pseudonocardiaceae bacterium]|nr:hypothetical protein [Pseudonocardiaceae bacterium]